MSRCPSAVAAGKAACIEPAAATCWLRVSTMPSWPVCRPFRPARQRHATITDTFLNASRVFIVVVIELGYIILTE